LASHHAGHIEPFDHQAVERRPCLEAFAGEDLNAAAPISSRQEEQGQQNENGQRDLPGDESDCREDEDDAHRIADGVRQNVGKRAPHADGVVGEAAGEGAGLDSLKERERKELDAFKEFHANRDDNSRADPGGEIGLDQLKTSVDQAERCDQRRQFDDERDVAGEDAPVDDLAVDQRADDSNRRTADHEHQEREQLASVWRSEGKRSTRDVAFDGPVYNRGIVAK